VPAVYKHQRENGKSRTGIKIKISLSLSLSLSLGKDRRDSRLFNPVYVCPWLKKARFGWRWRSLQFSGSRFLQLTSRCSSSPHLLASPLSPRPVAFMFERFWATNTIRIVQTGSYLANGLQHIQQKWLWLQSVLGESGSQVLRPWPFSSADVSAQEAACMVTLKFLQHSFIAAAV